MPNREGPAAGVLSRRSVLGWMVASAVALPAGIAGATQSVAGALAASTPTVAPRPYFPADVTKIPPTASLPDLFRFFSPLGSPDGRDRVTRASEWPARAAELSDLMQFYQPRVYRSPFTVRAPTPQPR